MEDKDKPKIQAGGLLLVLVGILFFSSSYSSIIGASSVSQVLTNVVIVIFFVGMGLGCIIKPESIGPIASAIAEIGKNFDSSGSKKVDQYQNNPSQSPQVNAGRDVSIQFTGQNEDAIRNERLQKEMDMLISPLYAKSNGTFKRIYFMKGSPGNIDSRWKRDQDYFEFWNNVSHNIYLAPDYLRNAYNGYMNKKSDTVGDTSRDRAYEKAEKEFIEEIGKRYEELRDQLKN
jgi:hypothetical protein